MSPYWDSTKAVAPGLEMGKRKGPDKTSGADVRYRPVQARASARRSKARRDSGGTPPQGRGLPPYLRSENGQIIKKVRFYAGSMI